MIYKLFIERISDIIWKQDIPIADFPLLPFSCVSPSALVLYTLSVCVFSDSLLPIVLSFLPHSHSASCASFLWTRRCKRGGMRIKKKKKSRSKEEQEGKEWCNVCTLLVQKHQNPTDFHGFVCVLWGWKLSTGSSLSAVHSAGKGVSFGCLWVWRWWWRDVPVISEECTKNVFMFLVRHNVQREKIGSVQNCAVL